MFKIFTRVKKLEETADFYRSAVLALSDADGNLQMRLRALEEYLGIEFFNGPMQKPHYRKTRVITKKMGRPKKVTK